MAPLAWANHSGMQQLLHDILDAEAWTRHPPDIRLDFLQAVCETPHARGVVPAAAEPETGAISLAACAACEAMRHALISDRKVCDLLLGGPATIDEQHDMVVKRINQLVLDRQEEAMIALMALQAPGRTWSESARFSWQAALRSRQLVVRSFIDSVTVCDRLCTHVACIRNAGHGHSPHASDIHCRTAYRHVLFFLQGLQASWTGVALPLPRCRQQHRAWPLRWLHYHRRRQPRSQLQTQLHLRQRQRTLCRCRRTPRRRRRSIRLATQTAKQKSCMSTRSGSESSTCA